MDEAMHKIYVDPLLPGKGDNTGMKKILQIILISTLWLAVAFTVFAEDIYVTGITNITMRTGPGVEHKILAMLKSGTKLEILEYQKDWSQVKTAGGKIGWVLSRFLTQKVPDALLVEKLQKENQALQQQLSRVKNDNKNLMVKNATLVQIEERYNKLKKESSDFLKLDAKHKELVKLSDEQKKRIQELEDDSNSVAIRWFLAGPGVLLVGFFIGLSTRKKRKSSLL